MPHDFLSNVYPLLYAFTTFVYTHIIQKSLRNVEYLVSVNFFDNFTSLAARKQFEVQDKNHPRTSFN